MLNYFHHFGTERCRSEIYKKITPKYESSLFFLIKFFSDIEKFLFTVVEFYVNLRISSKMLLKRVKLTQLPELSSIVSLYLSYVLRNNLNVHAIIIVRKLKKLEILEKPFY